VSASGRKRLNWLVPRPVQGMPSANEDALSHAMAMVAVPTIFGLLGAWIDSMIGTGPVLLLVFAAFGIACSFASAYYRYEAKIASHNEGKPWVRRETTRGEAAR
jgi:positive regulator of sigma E activity